MSSKRTEFVQFSSICAWFLGGAGLAQFFIEGVSYCQVSSGLVSGLSNSWCCCPNIVTIIYLRLRLIDTLFIEEHNYRVIQFQLKQETMIQELYQGIWLTQKSI